MSQVGNSPKPAEAATPQGDAPQPQPAPPPAPTEVPSPAADPGPASPPAPAEAAPKAGDGATPGAEAPKLAPATAPATKPDWKDKRIAELSAKLKTEREARAQAEAVGAGRQPNENDEQYQARVDAAATEKAAALTAVAEWNRRCNETAEVGRAKFPDFNDRLSALRSNVDAGDATEVARYNGFLAAAMETGAGAELIHEIGGDIEEFKRISALSPVKMAMELSRRAAAIKAPPAPSNAPRPITPIRGGSVAYDGIAPDDPERGTRLPIEAWMAQREKQAEERGLQ